MEAPHVPPSEAVRFRATLWTRWSDEDNQGVLNNAVYLTLFEEARHRYFGSLGLLDGNRFPFLLLQCDVRFLRPGRGGVPVTAEIATTALGTSSIAQAYRIAPADGSAPWCEAAALLVCVDAATGRSVPMPQVFRERVAAFEGLPSAPPAR